MWQQSHENTTYLLCNYVGCLTSRLLPFHLRAVKTGVGWEIGIAPGQLFLDHWSEFLALAISWLLTPNGRKGEKSCLHYVDDNLVFGPRDRNPLKTAIWKWNVGAFLFTHFPKGPQLWLCNSEKGENAMSLWGSSYSNCHSHGDGVLGPAALRTHNGQKLSDPLWCHSPWLTDSRCCCALKMEAHCTEHQETRVQF